MYITVQFKNKEKVFGGRLYDFEVNVKPPKKGSIIRMYEPDFEGRVCNATRVKVVDVKETSNCSQQEVNYVETTLDDNENFDFRNLTSVKNYVIINT